jgi:hypothetical protein
LAKSPSVTASDIALATDMQTTPSAGDSRGREPQEILFLVSEEKGHVSVTEPQEHVAPKLPLVAQNEHDTVPPEESLKNMFSVHETIEQECIGYLNPVFEDLDRKSVV